MKTATASLERIPLGLLDDHPQNPRLRVREDVLEAIVAGLADGFLREHAIRVRPLGDRYQIVSGHHRTRAAEKVGLDVIWAWVTEMTDFICYPHVPEILVSLITASFGSRSGFGVSLETTVSP